MPRIATLLIAVLLPCSLCCAQTLDTELATDLEEETASVQRQIEAAETEDAKYAGGLIKSLIGTRLEILRQTKAMLDQRANSWTFGIDLSFTIDGKPFVLPDGATAQISEVQTELDELDKKIADAEQEAARYRGGLVLAMKSSAIATMQQTRAMLDQKRLSIKYELPQYMPFAKAAGSDAQSEPPNTPEAPAEPRVKIVAVDARVTEKNNSWWKYAWKLTLGNPTEATMRYEATLEFQDSDGFVVDDDRAYDLVVAPGQEQVFTAYALVDASVAGNVASVGAKVGAR